MPPTLLCKPNSSPILRGEGWRGGGSQIFGTTMEDRTKTNLKETRGLLYIAGTTISNLIIITNLFCVHPLSSGKSRFDLVF